MNDEAPGPEEQLERTADELEHERDKLEDKVEELKDDWEAKKASDSVPGAQPDPDD